MRLLRIAPAAALLLVAYGCGVNRQLSAPTATPGGTTGATGTAATVAEHHTMKPCKLPLEWGSPGASRPATQPPNQREKTALKPWTTMVPRLRSATGLVSERGV